MKDENDDDDDDDVLWFDVHLKAGWVAGGQLSPAHRMVIMTINWHVFEKRRKNGSRDTDVLCVTTERDRVEQNIYNYELTSWQQSHCVESVPATTKTGA